MPPPPCVTADVFSDCFAGCVGVIPADGTVCGWTYDGNAGQNVSFTPGQMSLNTVASNRRSGAQKTLLSSLVSIFNTTEQFTFTEFPTALGAGSFYELYVTNFDSSEALYFYADDTGFVSVHVGLTAGAPFRSGAWTPTNGTHKVHIIIDALGVPLLFIDGIAIPLTVGGTFAFAGGIPGDTARLVVDDASGASSATVASVFMTAGNLPDPTVFCCP